MDIFYPLQETDETAVSVKKIGGNSAPVVLFVHGGYWQVGSRKIYSFVSKSWTKAGCVAAVVGYNLAPEVFKLEYYLDGLNLLMILIA